MNMNDMNPDFQTIKTTHLTASQTAQIEALAASCREAEPLRITFPCEEADLFYLLWENDSSTGAHGPEQARLLAAAAVCVPDGLNAGDQTPKKAAAGSQTAEVSAFTAPAARRQGCFSALLDMILEDFPDADLLFTVDNCCPAALKTLEALEAEHINDEYMMEIALEPLCPSSSSAAEPPNGLSHTLPADGKRYTIEDGGRQVGEFFLSPLNGSVYFYGFYIQPEFRGRGLGKSAFRRALEIACSCGFPSLLLQVSGDNTAAVALYKNAGLRIRETLSCYLY